MTSPNPVRVYIGGLPANIQTQELNDRFGRFVSSATDCQLTHVELPQAKGTEVSSELNSSIGRCRGFAYLTLQGTDAVTQSKALQKTYHRTKWRGMVLKVQVARPHFRQKLEQEWEEQLKERKQWELKRQAAQQLEIVRSGEEVRPLKLTVPFQGRRTTNFEKVDEVERLQVVGQEGGTVETDTESVVEEESAGESDGEGLREDDVEGFIKQYLKDEAAGMEKEMKQPQKVLSREEMNARRLAALEAKQKRKKEVVVIPAIGAALGNKKITFDDSGNEHEVDEHEVDEQEEEAGVTLNWMDSSDDETRGGDSERKTLDFVDGCDTEAVVDAEVQTSFALRPEFVGEKGQKLFEMQKRFGGDSRFRLDARFLEEEANEYGGNDVEVETEQGIDEKTVAELQTFLDDEDSEVAARHAREMREEQETALRVVAKLYPDVDVTRLQRRMQEQRVPKDPLKEAAWMGELKRYDPRDAHACREFEIPMTVAVSGPQEVTVASKDSKEIPTGGDRFFSTAGDLSNLFSRVRKNSEDGEEGEAALDGVFGLGTAASGSDAPFKLSSLFSFPAGTDKPLAAMGEQLLEEDQEEEGPNAPDSAFSQGFHPSDFYHEDEAMATDSEAGDDADDVKQTKAAPTKKCAKKTLDDFFNFGKTFVGGGDEIAADWPERRKKLTLDYKRKRRDAVKMKKRQNKQQSKVNKTKSATNTTETATSSKWKKARL
uniref:RRM domain-containing protein n=1 Tax=Hyaloperonospora arabidopsidis (strain Emoy2) TaxID=559515 RepID=M4BBQ7_HYAAE